MAPGTGQSFHVPRWKLTCPSTISGCERAALCRAGAPQGALAGTARKAAVSLDWMVRVCT